MKTDLQGQIRELIDSGARPVTVSEITCRQPADLRKPLPPARPEFRYRRAAAIAAGVAVICAGAITARQLAAQPGHAPASRGSVVLTAAMVHQVASASSAALALSGRAQIAFRDTLGGVLQDTGTDSISFSGQNYNLVLRETLPAADGTPASRQSAINRVVKGQAYDYFVASHGLRWYHDTGPHAVADLSIPDPRTLLRALQPSARFELVGHQSIGGVRLEHLRATDLRHLSALSSIRELRAGQHVTALDVWADSHGVVRQMSISAHGSSTEVVTVPSGRRARALMRQLLNEYSKLVTGRHLTPARARAAMDRSAAVKRDRRLLQQAGGGPRLEVPATTLVVRFLDIGRPQVITAPPHAINVYGRG